LSSGPSGLLDAPELQIPDKLVDMAQSAVDMLHRSIDAYVKLDSQLARKVCRDDDSIDQANAAMIKHLIDQMHHQPDRLDALLHLFSAVRQVERVADHATNIAEDVVYLVEGKIIRHWKTLDRDDLRETR
jgi:phosphate transport system protein